MSEVDEPAEVDEWGRLRRHLELDEGAWVGYVIGDRGGRSLVRERVRGFLQGRGRGFQEVEPASVAELAPALDALLKAKGGALLWLEPVAAGTDRAWASAWVSLANRLNEHREALRRGGHAILIAIDAEAKRILHEHAPDLWSTRAVVVEERAAPPPSPPLPAPSTRVLLVRAAVDAKAAARLTRALEARGFVVDPGARGGGLGGRWALDQGVAGSEGAIVWVSAALLGSRGSAQEVALVAREARRRGLPLVPVLGDIQDLGALPRDLAERAWVDLRGQEGPDFERQVDRVAEALRGRRR